MRLLVIEDNRNLVANLFQYFEARGHVLDAAPDGITGLHLALTQHYDALVLDWMLPRMDGPEVLRRLRDEGDSDLPVIMLTARDELPDKLADFRAGADDYLTKPFDLEELFAQEHVEAMEVGRFERPLVSARPEVDKKLKAITEITRELAARPSLLADKKQAEGLFADAQEALRLAQERLDAVRGVGDQDRAGR